MAGEVYSTLAALRADLHFVSRDAMAIGFQPLPRSVKKTNEIEVHRSSLNVQACTN